jgi:hypothetical protein
MDKQGHSTIKVLVAIATLIVVAAAAGFAIYQRRGDTVFQEERPFSPENTHFEFALSTPDIEHRLFLALTTHYTGDYNYTLQAHLIFPSGGELEKEILKFEHGVDLGTNTTETSHQLVWKFLAEKGIYTLKLSLQDIHGPVTLNQVKLVVKKL